MRRSLWFFILVLLCGGGFLSASAATGKVVKVLPHYLDLQGRHTLSPSLFDRDAYQAELRKNPALRSGLRFDVLWQGRSTFNDPAVVRVELRGTAKGNLPSQLTLETPVRLSGLRRWTAVTLAGKAYQEFGEVTAWRVTLWDGEQLLGEQKSFLW